MAKVEGVPEVVGECMACDQPVYATDTFFSGDDADGAFMYHNTDKECKTAAIARATRAESALRAAREDAARLDWLETELRKGFWGRRVLHFGEWDITCYPEGFHVSNDPAADPIIDGCSLRDALDAVKDQQLSEILNLDAGNSRYHKPLPPLETAARRADGGR